jgi:lipopolysaccharide transport protein LptA
MRKWPGSFMALAMLLVPLLSGKVAAQNLRFATDSQAPLFVEAGAMIWQRNAAQAQLSDNARLHQGPLGLSADKLEITFAANGKAQLIRAIGEVALRSSGDSQSAARHATAERAWVNLTEQTIMLTGNVVMHSEADEQARLSGGQLTLDMASGRARLSGTADKPRARIELR